MKESPLIHNPAHICNLYNRQVDRLHILVQDFEFCMNIQLLNQSWQMNGVRANRRSVKTCISRIGYELHELQ
jgi:hypothetical protein